MTDRELLKNAAKACDYWNFAFNCFQGPANWSPLTDDADAFQLAIKLRLDINHYPASKEVGAVQHKKGKGTYRREFEIYDDDPYRAARRVIVRCAAEIGKLM